MRHLRHEHYPPNPPRGQTPPHAMASSYISREHMLALHRTLLKWLLTGSPPSLSVDECMRPDISAPPIPTPELHRTLSIAAATALPPGRLCHPSRVSTPTPAPRTPTPPPHAPSKKARPLLRAPMSILTHLPPRAMTMTHPHQ